MDIAFCDECEARVSDVDLASGLGLRRGYDVICAACVHAGKGDRWLKAHSARQAVATPSAPSSAHLRIAAARNQAQTVRDAHDAQVTKTITREPQSEAASPVSPDPVSDKDTPSVATQRTARPGTASTAKNAGSAAKNATNSNKSGRSKRKTAPIGPGMWVAFGVAILVIIGSAIYAFTPPASKPRPVEANKNTPDKIGSDALGITALKNKIDAAIETANKAIEAKDVATLKQFVQNVGVYSNEMYAIQAKAQSGGWSEGECGEIQGMVNYQSLNYTRKTAGEIISRYGK